jgi:hypothetical protein
VPPADASHDGPTRAAAGAADVPFPVDVPYRMRTDLTRLDGSPFLEGPDADRLRTAKLDALRFRPERVRALDPRRSPAAIAADVAATLPTLARLRPDVVRPAGASEAAAVDDPAGQRAWAFPRLGDEALGIVADAPWPTRLADALALSLPEDLVWMHDDGEGGRAALLHVCFPSHWPPDERGGAGLAELHGPVADGERLRAASRALMRAIAEKGPFERFVWSLNPTAALDRHPRAAGPAGRPPGPGGPGGAGRSADAPAASAAASPAASPPAAAGAATDPIDATWFRVERQTTLPFPEARVALFLIRVLVAPLREVLATEAGRAARLAASIRSMSPGVAAYKGVTDGGPALLDALDAWTRREARPG